MNQIERLRAETAQSLHGGVCNDHDRIAHVRPADVHFALAEVKRLRDLFRSERHLRFADSIRELDLSPFEVASRADEWRMETEELICEAAEVGGQVDVTD